MQRKAKQRKAKQRRAKRSNVVCRSTCQCPIFKPQQIAGFGWRARFAPSAPPRIALPLFASPLLSYLCVCRTGAEQSKATKSKATKSKAKKSKANQRRLSVCLSASYPQTTTSSRIQVACTFRPIRPSSPRLALSLFSSPLLSYLCVRMVGAQQSNATKRKATKSKAK
jgi:hypothetical protein